MAPQRRRELVQRDRPVPLGHEVDQREPSLPTLERDLTNGSGSLDRDPPGQVEPQPRRQGLANLPPAY